MTRPLLRILAAAVLALLLLPALALAAPTFPPLTGRVVDNAQILSPAAEARLDGQLAALEQKTGQIGRASCRERVCT